MGNNREYIEKPYIEIIVLNWNGRDDTLECLRSLQKVDYPNYHVIVVDNGSTDGSIETILYHYPLEKWFTIIENGRNLGYTGGNNVGIRYAIEYGADYILLLNNDTIVEPHFLDQMIYITEQDKHIGILGPKIYCYPESSKLWPWGIGGEMDWRKGRTKNLKTQEIERGQWDVMRDVDYVSGCAIFVRRNVFEKIGFFDERYFLYYEEVDFCLRAKRAGFRVVFVPDSVIWHKSNASSGDWNSSLRLYYTTRNRLLFMKTYLDEDKWHHFLLYFFYEGIFKRAAKLFLTRRCGIRDLRALWRGWKDFYHGRFYRGPDEIHQKVERIAL